MLALSPLVRLRILLRSLAIQGSWNYQTMQGAGIGFALIPVLARLHRRDPASLAESLKRHTRFYNGHPYLATVAIAAVARMESEQAQAEEIERFKSAIVSPLGSIGDRLVWARWRPLCSLLGLTLFLAGAPWWVASAAFLALYNAVHLALRVWGLHLGWREGRDVGRALMGSPLRRLPDRLTIPLAAVAGALLPLLALGLGGPSGAGSLSVIGIALVLAVVGAWRPAVAGRLAVLVPLVGSLVVMALGSSIG
ncbi:MAG: PTS system mannose/fructose/sorbose family transporter subunit IID [Gemmatimonadota bacterium]|nr:MAG: PTS system mannose/fructose/sorbose family transporter subunit IID [Gemmatimonadota bacterium]